VSELEPGRVSGTQGHRDDVKYVARGMMTRAEVKRAVRLRDDMKCVKCGMDDRQHREEYGRTLDVHRKDPGSLYTLDGCITLCCGCHGAEPWRATGDVDVEGPRHPRKAFHAPAELFAALEQYIVTTRPQPTEAAVLRIALEEFLQRHGLWPTAPLNPPAKKPRKGKKP
jgi:cytochrome c553